MQKQRSVRSKITLAAIGCFLAGMLVVLLTLFFYLQNVFNRQARETLLEQGEKYSNMIADQFGGPLSFLAGVCGMVEGQVATGNVDRVALQQYVYRAYDQYAPSEGSALMFEPNAYDGLDSQYINSDYGTVYTGRVSYYYYRENGQTLWLPQTEDDELEFVQPYYVTSRGTGEPSFSEPYIYTVGDRSDYMITASHPLRDDQSNVLGIMTVDLYLNTIHELMSAEQIYDTGYIVVVSEDGMVLYSPDLSTVGQDARELGLLYDLPDGSETVRYSEVSSFVNNKSSIAATVPVTLQLADSRFYVSVVAPHSEVNAVYIRLVVIMVVIVLLVGAAIAVAIGLVTGRIIRPLGLMRRLVGQVGETGNLTLPEQELDEVRAAAAVRDEIGESLSAFIKMLEQFVYYGECLRTVADRDLTLRVNTLSELDTCGVALQDMVDNLNAVFSEIRAAAYQVSSGSVQIDNASQGMASGASEQAASIEEFQSTLEQIQTMATENAEVSTSTLDGVQQSEQVMQSCTSAMEQTLGVMQEVDSKSQSISRVIKVIDDIAFQTNILALNAAVEAARAGQHGKGFAVVADEVRNLASKSAEAAKETAQLIASSTGSVAEGTGMVARVSENLQNVRTISNQNMEWIETLHESSVRQREAITEITASIQQLSSVVQANSSTAEETAASAEQMSAQSARLGEILAQFKLLETTLRAPTPSVHPAPEESLSLQRLA